MLQSWSGKEGNNIMNGYIGIYKGKKYEVYANSSYEAQTKLAEKLSPKKQYEIDVYLCEKDGEDVTQWPN